MQALVSVEGLKREVKVGRQNRGLGTNAVHTKTLPLVYPQKLSSASISILT